MENENYFDLLSSEATNDNLIVKFFDEFLTSYKYKIIKDSEEFETGEFTSEHSFYLTETGSYQIIVFNNLEVFETGTYLIDKEAPVIKFDNDIEYMAVGDTFDVYKGIKVTDNVDGNISNKVITNYKDLDFTILGPKELTYTAVDMAGNISTETQIISVSKNNTATIFRIQISIVLILFLIFWLLVNYIKGILFERRIASYVVTPLKGSSVSIFDSASLMIKKFVKSISSVIGKSSLLSKHSSKFNKYSILENDSRYTGIDYISFKLLSSVLILFITVIFNVLNLKMIGSIEVIFSLLIGYFLPNLYYRIRFALSKDKIDNDLLQAVIIMNNSFKAGSSIIQAMETVSNELDGRIALEFEKMSVELSLGLSVEVVFDRFSKRVDVAEISFLTATLSILNKTGGNIVKVFDSIERSLFNKKKLKIELDNLTKSSKFIVTLLSVLPLIFIVLIVFVNPAYFMPLFSDVIGYIIMGMIALIYIVYLVFVFKVMKVEF